MRFTPQRFRWAIGVALMVGAIAAGWWLASLFQSPDQREADAAAPSPSPIVAAATSGTLEARTSFSGQVVASAQHPVTFTAPADATTAVVTGRALKAGAILRDGDLVTEVNGRPVFALASPFAFYRDMALGDSGPDVRALQRALASRGYGVGADGVFGGQTERAVRAWYTDAGYAPAVRATTDDGTTPGSPAADAAQVAGASVPVAEIQSVPSLPTSVVKGITVGSPVAVKGTPDVVLGSTDKVVSVSMDPAAMASVAKGDRVTLIIGSAETDGRVTSLVRSTSPEGSPSGDGSSSQNDAAPTSEASLVVTPASPLGDIALGAPARVIVERAVVSKKSILVPVIAITDRGGDNRVVLVRRKDGTFREIRVTVLGTLDGQAAVAPAKGATLRVADEVKVG